MLFSAQAAFSAGTPIPSVKGTYDVTGPLNVSLTLSAVEGGKTKPFIKLTVGFGDVGLVGETFTFTTTAQTGNTGPFYDGTGFLSGTWTQKVDKSNNLTKDFFITLDLQDIIQMFENAGITATVTSQSFKGSVAMKNGVKTISGSYSYTANLVGGGDLGLVGTLKVSGSGSGTLSTQTANAKYGPVEPGSPAALRNFWANFKESVNNYRTLKKKNP